MPRLTLRRSSGSPVELRDVEGRESALEGARRLERSRPVHARYKTASSLPMYRTAVPCLPTALSSSPATRTRTASPTSWPNRSLISLKLSGFIMMRAAGAALVADKSILGRFSSR